MCTFFERYVAFACKVIFLCWVPDSYVYYFTIEGKENEIFEIYFPPKHNELPLTTKITHV